MLPRLISPQFGLLDDGRSLSVARGIAQGKWDFSWDIQAGRIRPIYWAVFAFWYLLADGHPFWFFLGNLIIVSATTFLLIRLVAELGGSNLQAWITGILFILSTPLIENTYTLSKAEIFQLFMIVASIWLVVLAVKIGKGFKYWAGLTCAGILLLSASFTKENTLVMIPISLAWWLTAWIGQKKRKISALAEKVTRWIALSSLVSGVIFYLLRSIYLSTQVIGVGQSSGFSFNLSQLINSAVRWGGWLLRDFIWLFPLALFVLASCLVRHQWPHSGLYWFSGIWMVFWLGLYLPWHFAVGYYLLPFTAGTSVLAGCLFIDCIDIIKRSHKLWKGLSIGFLIITSIFIFTTQANSYTDAAIQLTQDSVNSKALEYIANNAPIGSHIVVNIQLANEYVEQMQLMLTDFYTRPDLQLENYQGGVLKNLTKGYPETYILVAEVSNQPKMTIRMGLNEDSLSVWNSSMLPLLETWQQKFQVSENPRLLYVDYPRLLCAIIYRENYCSSPGSFLNDPIFHYNWKVYATK